MKPPSTLVVAVLGAALLSGALYWWLSHVPAPVYAESHSLRYTLVVSNTTNRAVADGRIWTYAPLRSTPSQRVDRLEASEDFSVAEDQWGNQVLEFPLGLLPPYGQREVVISADVALAEPPNRWTLGPESPGGSPAATEPPVVTAIAEAAASIRTGTDGDLISAIEGWVAEHVRPSNYDAVDRGALHALQERRGDCSEFSALVVALAGVKGLPARVIDGWTLDDGGNLDAAGFHSWAEVWDGNTWRIADAHARAERRARMRYVGFRIAPDAIADDGSGFARFRYQGEGLTVRMK